MKKIKSFTMGVVFLFATLSQTGCIGSFKMTTNLYDWNQNLSSKALQELVFLAFVIIPVYGVTLAIDAIILNSIEFWSGSNPMAMEEGEIEEQIVKQKGTTFKITATKNKFHVEQLDGSMKGQNYDLVYYPEEESWYLEANGQKQRIAELNVQNQAIQLYKPGGEHIEVVAGTSKQAVKAAINLELEELTYYK
jgi:hypothetical protein